VRHHSVYYTTDRDEVPHLRDEHRRRLATGLDVRWVEGAGLRSADHALFAFSRTRN
jgi:hypothetical protein